MVYVVEDDPANRELFDELCATVGLGVKTYSNARQFLADPPPVGLGCIVLDIRMPGMSGLDLQRELSKRGIELPIIFVTAHGETNLAVRAMKEGAFDFIEKPFDNGAMLRCIRKALSHAEEVAEDAARRAEIQCRLNRLTPRERDVLDLISTGALNKQIAHRLGIAQRTVEVHRANVMDKMKAKSAADLIRMVVTVEPPRPLT